jgi:hypothetical protein
MTSPSFENFPWHMVVISNTVGLAIYAIGFYLMASLWIVLGAIYIAYCIWMEVRVLSKSCRGCYYYGKRCGFGKGIVCSWFFKKDTEKTLSAKRITWLDIAPDFMVSLIPLGAGIILLVRDFSWPVLFLILTLVLLGSAGTGFVRGQIACKYCKQRELNCPAEQLFGETKKA